jgi:hypothetical protein
VQDDVDPPSMRQAASSMSRNAPVGSTSFAIEFAVSGQAALEVKGAPPGNSPRRRRAIWSGSRRPKGGR